MVNQGKLAVYDAPGKPFAIRMFPIRPPKPGEVDQVGQAMKDAAERRVLRAAIVP